MKKIIYTFFAIAALASSASCSQSRLEIEQKGVTPYESFYKTDEDALSALTNAYAQMTKNVTSVSKNQIPYIAITNLCGDDMLAGGNYYGDNDFDAAMNEFRYDNQVDPIVKAYQQLYYANYAANLVIDNFSGDKATSQIKKRCVAEARVLRAFYHMTLAIYWGCPPLVDHILEGNVKPYNCDRDPNNPKTHNELLEWCAQECEAAAADLNERSGVDDADATIVVTKGFAYSIAGKSYLFAGNYAKAKEALKKVIASGKYALVPGERLNECFHAVGDGNEEKIFEANAITDGSITDATFYARSRGYTVRMWNWRTDKMEKRPTIDGIDGWGICAPTQSFTKELIANDGLDSWRLKSTIINVEDVMDKYKGGGIKDVTGLYACHEWMSFKIIPTPADVYKKGSQTNVVFMRYAEVLLMYAEACAMTKDNDGLQYLKAIQTRAGSQHISSELTLDEVKKEKKFEMWAEGCRWADMVRWGDFDGVLNAGKNIPSLYDNKWTKESTATRFYVKYSNPNTQETGFKKGKHELFPYPYYEINTNPNMKQNPGW